MGGAQFHFAKLIADAQRLKAELVRVTSGSSDERVAALAEEVQAISFSPTDGEAPPLSVAFVGQYNAGKSTIIRALTGRSDIAIDADVCTDRVTAYDWNGIRILDTPGIHAGFAEHDDKTYAAMDRVDLLSFVITSELFDATIGAHFRNLAFKRGRSQQMLLVVNKMGLDCGTVDVKRADIEKVTSPMSCQDFNTVFIDAKSKLDSDASFDEQDRVDLMELSNFDAFVAGLNRFVADRGIIGRLTSPICRLRGVVDQAVALLSVELPEEKAALELLHRKRGAIHSSRSRLRRAISGLVGQAVADISRFGDEVAETIEPGSTKEDVEARHQDAQERSSDRCQRLANDLRETIQAELDALRRELGQISDGVLARDLRSRLGDKTSDGFGPGPQWSRTPDLAGLADWPAKAKRIGDIANGIGNWAARWAAGPAVATAAEGSAMAAKGSQAHEAVYAIGKFFNYKFQPWEAVNVARTIGNVGRVVGAVGGILAIFAQIMEDQQQDEHRKSLREGRDQVRLGYREAAGAAEKAVWGHAEAFLTDFYDSELQAVDDEVDGLVGRRQQRGVDVGRLSQLVEWSKSLMDRFTEASRVVDPGAN